MDPETQQVMGFDYKHLSTGLTQYINNTYYTIWQDLPDSGTTLFGIDRARMLKAAKVEIGDVSRDDEPSGRVGLAREIRGIGMWRI